uniref:Helitron helicase-like domain-containing protein n=1 Tax=Amphimedon queenslandica TaxID=400682 RepID=A0A1X7UDL7_AMPQE
MNVKEAPINNRQEHLDLGNVGQTAAEILHKMNVLDEEFEGNLSTVLAPIQGTNQSWFHVKGEVKAMIAEYGSPTLFLTLSCAEYDSAEIAQYLRKVNNAPQSYSISRLCTEDPISVSRQFSYKF